MALTGKYNFKGIKKMGVSAINVALLSSPKTAWILKFKRFTDIIFELLIGYLSNKGLVVLNLGAIVVNSEIDQSEFDKSFDKALNEIIIKQGREKLTPAQIKAIDDEIIKVARKFIVVSNPK